MEDKQDLFDRLVQIKDSYDTDPELAQRVVDKINQRESTVTFKEPVPKWFWVALCFIIVAAVVAYLSVYFTTTQGPKITVYSAESIEFEDITDMESFCSENNVGFKFFKDKTDVNSIAKIKGTDTYAYVMQEFDDIGEVGFDKLELKVVLLQNSEFEFYSSFVSLNDEFVVENITVYYSIYDRIDGNNLFAKFEFESKSYFLEILTQDSGTAVLEKYVNQLLN